MPDLLVEKHGHTTVFTINRPERMNSLGGTVSTDLTEGLKEFQADRDQYVAIITGAGDKAFCAGGDLKEMAAGAESGQRLPISPSRTSAGWTRSTRSPSRPSTAWPSPAASSWPSPATSASRPRTPGSACSR